MVSILKNPRVVSTLKSIPIRWVDDSCCFLFSWGIFVNPQKTLWEDDLSNLSCTSFSWIGSKTGLKTITIYQLIQKVERSITFFFCPRHLDGMPRCWSFSSFPVPTTRSMWIFGTFQFRLEIAYGFFLTSTVGPYKKISCKSQVDESPIS